jgi:sugar lactone lactonase YvrE
MILNVMVWSEGPTWWQDKLVFSDTRLEKIYSWDPKTELTEVVLEKAGYG